MILSSCGIHTINVTRAAISRVILSYSSDTMTMLLPYNNTAAQSPQWSYYWLTHAQPHVTFHLNMTWSIPLCHSNACATADMENEMDGPRDRLVRICAVNHRFVAGRGCLGWTGKRRAHFS